MSSSWEFDLRNRLDTFHHRQKPSTQGISVSIKVRVTGGCYHREHSPIAYKVIDKHLSSMRLDESISFGEHESGPELLVYLMFGTAVLTLSKSIIDLITAFIKARSDGIKKGDRPSEPLELIVRTFDKDGKLAEETVLHIDSRHAPARKHIQLALEQAINRMLSLPQHRRGRGA